MKPRILTFLSLPFLAFMAPALVFAQQTPEPAAPSYYGPYWHGPGHMWGGWGFGWGGPLMILGIVVVCILVLALVRRSGDGWHHHHHRGPSHMRGGTDPYGDPTYTAMQILNERFARGEIQKPEYEEKKAAILSTGQR